MIPILVDNPMTHSALDVGAPRRYRKSADAAQLHLSIRLSMQGSLQECGILHVCTLLAKYIAVSYLE